MRLANSLIAFALLAFLSACNAVSGFGEDVQTGGEAITDTAEDTADAM